MSTAATTTSLVATKSTTTTTTTTTYVRSTDGHTHARQGAQQGQLLQQQGAGEQCSMAVHRHRC